MGRRPNALMAQYFRRGQKISDSSNRYEQTCNKCGEHFIKGRTETMVIHLTKKCPCLSKIEKAEIVLRLHDIGPEDLSPTVNVDDINAFLSAPAFPGPPPLSKPGDPPVGLPPAFVQRAIAESASSATAIQDGQEQANYGLNVLAEASRQVGSNASNNATTVNGQVEQNAGPPVSSQPPGATAAGVPVDPQLEPGHNFHDDLVDDTGNVINAVTDAGFSINTTATTTLTNLPSLYQYVDTLQPVTKDDLHTMSLISASAPDLSAIAATARDTLNRSMMDNGMDMANNEMAPELFESVNEHGYGPQNHTPMSWNALPVTNQLLAQTSTTSSGPSLGQLSTHLPGHPIGFILDAPSLSGRQPLRPLAMNPNGIAPSGSVRVPGDTTASSLTANPKRKGSRARFTAERRKEVQQVRKLGACVRCRVLRKVCSEGDPCKMCAGVDAPRRWVNACFRTKLVHVFLFYTATLHSVLAHVETNALKQKNMANFKPLTIGFLHAHHGLGATMSLKAIEITFAADAPAHEGEHEQQPSLVPPQQQIELVSIIDMDGKGNVTTEAEQYVKAVSARIIQDEPSHVMKTSLEFAVALKDRKTALAGTDAATAEDKHPNLLSDVIQLWCATVLLCDFTTYEEHFSVDVEDGQGQVFAVGIEPDGHNHQILQKQLRAVIEKRANALGRPVLQHFEQRLFSRHFTDTSKFETVLMAIILLNCAERMAWLFTHKQESLTEWPLETSAGDYVDKATVLFAGTVQQIFTLRDLGPALAVDPETGFVVARNADVDADLAGWLSAVQFTATPDLTLEFPGPAKSGSRSLDGSLSARLLQLSSSA